MSYLQTNSAKSLESLRKLTNATLSFAYRCGNQFIKLFTSYSDMVNWVKANLKPTDTVDSIITLPLDRQDVSNWHNYGPLMQELFGLMGVEHEGRECYKTRNGHVDTRKDESYRDSDNLPCISLQFKVMEEPTMTYDKKHHEKLLKLMESKRDYFDMIHHLDDFVFSWKAAVMVRLVFDEISNEIKVPGQPYFPGGKRTVESDWMWLYLHKINKDEDYYSVLTIDKDRKYTINERCPVNHTEIYKKNIKCERVKIVTTQL